ncbi:hypothetical protein AVEN_198144-1 [Araneus ventricosus]|uniref:Uncharacterized protein n=1 Tax=Araneus ventricosus TaxID=182803 RepID=A0A4Y2JDD7_ARAVE|nr:hypothetical protein AVEN_198144-1 [Araneus ventricosus]
MHEAETKVYYDHAMDIVSQADEIDDLSTVTVKLGGFHLLMSSMGTVGILPEDRVNCDSADELGENSVRGIVGKRFANVTLKRKVQVFTPAAMGNTLRVDKDPVVVNPNQLFHRIACITTRSANDLEDCLLYELVPYPQSIFDDVGLRTGLY